MLQVSQIRDVVCIRVPRQERGWFIQQLRRLQGSERLELATATGIGLLFERTECDFSISVGDACISFRLPWKEIEYLIDAMEEHVNASGVYELDHPFEPLGAIIKPRTIADVVIETQ